MATTLDHVLNAGRVRLRLRSRAAMARALRLTGAAVAAFVVAQLVFPGALPILAPLTALLVVEVTLKDIVTSGLQRVASVTAGVLVAVAFSSIVGLTWWSLGALIAVSILLGQLLRLGPHLLEVPISAMLVLAVGGAEAAAVDRISETLIGAAVGVLVNLLFPPQVRAGSAAEAVQRFAGELARLLNGAAAELREPITQDQAERWMSDARTLSRNVPRIDSELLQAQDSRRLNPRALVVPDTSKTLRADLDALEHTTVAVRSMFRSIRDGVRDNPTVDPTRGENLRELYAALLTDLAATIEAFGELARAEGTDSVAETQQEVAAALADLSEARDRIDDLQLIDIGAQDNGWELSEPVLEAVGLVLRDLDINERGRRRAAARVPVKVPPLLQTSLRPARADGPHHGLRLPHRHTGPGHRDESPAEHTGSHLPVHDHRPPPRRRPTAVDTARLQAVGQPLGLFVGSREHH